MRTSPSILFLAILAASPVMAATTTRLRVVMSTDLPPIGVCISSSMGCGAERTSDPDDLQSIVRFLLYSNEFDIEGFVVSSATFANVAKKQNMLDVLAVYDKVYANLKTHDPLFPTAATLSKVTFQGRSGTWGKTTTNNIGAGKDSEASDAIIAIVDKPDPRPIWFGIWGDVSNVAQAIWKVQNTRSAAELKTFLAKIRIFQIAHQDDSIDWLMSTLPELFIVYSKQTYQGMFGGSDPLSNTAWVNTNVIKNHGPLGAIYPSAGMGSTGVAEGDSPSFLYLVSANRGINDPEDPTQPSWGGQYKLISGKHWGDGVGASSISKWRKDYQAEFAERADWMIMPATSVSPRDGSSAIDFRLRRAGNRMELAFLAPKSGPARMDVVDLGGRIVLSESFPVEEGVAAIRTFDPGSSPTGMYTVRLRLDGVVYHCGRFSRIANG